MAWFEDLGGAAFSDTDVLSDEALKGRAAFAADLDGDIDLGCGASGPSHAIARELAPTRDPDVDGLLDGCESVGSTSCLAGQLNSVGAQATIGALDSEKATETERSITASDLPTGSADLFFAARTRVFRSFPAKSLGTMCMGGSIGRGVGGGILTSGAMGTFIGTVDLTALAQPTGPIADAAGKTWYFPAW